ncbi:hypothetical protein [Sulfurimonas sp.]
MYRLLLGLLLTTTIVMAQEKPLEVMQRDITVSYPYAYAALGNIIYKNAPNIAKLQNIDEYVLFQGKIQKYLKNVEEAKKYGFTLDEHSSNTERKKYLDKLRALAVINDFYVRSVDDKFNIALEQENSKLFSELVNSGLLKIKRYKEEILQYYYEHKDDINPQGTIEKLLAEEKKVETKAKIKKVIKHIKYQSKRERELEKIRYIRKKDKKEQEKLEKQLQDELEKKKREIREYQKEELSKTK